MIKTEVAKAIVTEGIDEGFLRSVAIKTDGFSGRELSKLAIAWQASAYGTEGAVCDTILMNRVLEEFMTSKKQKEGWLSGDYIHQLTSNKIDKRA